MAIEVLVEVQLAGPPTSSLVERPRALDQHPLSPTHPANDTLQTTTTARNSTG